MAAKRKAGKSTVTEHPVGTTFQLSPAQTKALQDANTKVRELKIALANLVASFELQKTKALEEIHRSESALRDSMTSFAKMKKVDLTTKDQAWKVALETGELSRVH